MATIKLIIPIIQIVISIALVVSILLQQRGTGLSAAFGGDGNVYRTKRGIEKLLFRATIVLVSLLLLTAILNIVL
ncbi:MAG: preprotein translocase subunit SecG [Candidatus Sungbacteria bacterium]|nr:preprotein translocase subunit SecG [Candidatus Sungbacteria bacterium]